jgi:phosphoribosylaminoimidazole-succinocarboxamide synthase
MSVLNTDLKLPGATSTYHGKVRDVYTIKDKYLVMVASDRISAFDVILPHPIPFKGQVLNQLAAYFLEATKDVAPNWLLSVPDPRVSIGIKCLPVKVEMVIRGYLAGHAWREYKSGKRMICGVLMPDGLKENDKFPEPIITPTSKADAGHDEDISKEDILKSNIITPEKYELMEYYTRELFKKGTEMAKERGLILVDTKYEFGLHDGKILLMDEIHTPDSSRYFYLEGYAERQKNNEHQKQLSKEFVREWLIENNFMGKEGQSVPEMGEEWLKTISSRYIELYEMVTGKKFIPVETNSESISSNIIIGLKKLGVV